MFYFSASARYCELGKSLREINFRGSSLRNSIRADLILYNYKDESVKSREIRRANGLGLLGGEICTHIGAEFFP